VKNSKQLLCNRFVEKNIQQKGKYRRCILPVTLNRSYPCLTGYASGVRIGEDVLSPSNESGAYWLRPILANLQVSHSDFSKYIGKVNGVSKKDLALR
jgi:hypothetical protein